MEQVEDEEWTAAAAADDGGDPSIWVQEPDDEPPPEIEGRLFPVWMAFQRLSRGRPSGMGLSAISIEAVDRYLSLLGFSDPDLAEEWLDIIQGMDQAWMDHHHKRQVDQDRETAELRRRNTARTG
jgi:hypothetical protein